MVLDERVDGCGVEPDPAPVELVGLRAARQWVAPTVKVVVVTDRQPVAQGGDVVGRPVARAVQVGHAPHGARIVGVVLHGGYQLGGREGQRARPRTAHAGLLWLLLDTDLDDGVVRGRRRVERQGEEVRLPVVVEHRL